MADRKSVIKGLEPIIGCAKQEKWGAWIDTLEDAFALLKAQPEIVRCKDCKKFIPPHGCMHIENYIDADWFCADGERK